MSKKVIQLLGALLVINFLFLLPISEASNTKQSSQPLSSGVTLHKYIHQGMYTNRVNDMEINLLDKYTTVDVGLPAKFGGLLPTTSLANALSKEGHRYVGAINAAFYDMTTGFPMYLISEGNTIYNGGILAKSATAYVSQPNAFGVTADGKAEIDSFNFQILTSFKGRTEKIVGLNRERQPNESIVFTPQHHRPVTGSNHFGVEYLITTDEDITATTYGSNVTGKVKYIRRYGDKAALNIPKNGFVISVNGTQSEKFSTLAIGDEVNLSIAIDNKWQDSKFMLASGPMLVRDGKRYLTIDPNSSRAREIAPRSAIAISKDKTKVHFITVDGRLSNSKGMNLIQFADYIASLGYDRAINLDGGGSTTMGARSTYGSNVVYLANSPSGGGQRSVSAILGAISTAYTTKATQVKYTRTNVGVLLAGAGVQLNYQYFLDAYYNPLPLNLSRIKLHSTNGFAKAINSTTIVTTKGGQDRIAITYDDNVVDTFPITVVDEPETLYIRGKNKLNVGQEETYKIDVTAAGNQPLIYNANQVKYEVEGTIGKITADGKFTAMQEGRGFIVVTLGKKTMKYEVEVKDNRLKPGEFIDVRTTHEYYEPISYLATNGIVTGYGDAFKPEDNILRQHVAVILQRYLKLSTANISNPNFNDVATNHLYFEAIAVLENNGIMSGSNQMFKPNDNLTRAQMAKILAETFNLTGTSNLAFTDVPSEHWANEYVQALAANNITTGYPNGTFQPNALISRQHFSALLYRAIQNRSDK